MLLILALERLMQEDQEFEVIVGHIERSFKTENIEDKDGITNALYL